MTRAATLGLLLCVATACGSSQSTQASGLHAGRPPGVASTPHSEPKAKRDTSTNDVPKATPPPPLVLTRGRQWTLEERRVLRRPVPARLSTSELAGIRLEPVDSQGYWVVIDDQTPRPLLGGAPLADLVLEDRELSPGGHVLVVFRASASEPSLQFEVASFELDSSSVSATDGRPDCLLVLPLGTHHGVSAAARIEVLALPLADEVGRISLDVRGAFAHVTQELLPRQSALLSTTESGDIQIELSCIEGAEVSPDSVVRTIVVNRDAEAPDASAGAPL